MAFDEKLTRLNNLQSLMAVADADCAIRTVAFDDHSPKCVFPVGITGDISDLLQASRLKTIKYAAE